MKTSAYRIFALGLLFAMAGGLVVSCTDSKAADTAPALLPVSYIEPVMDSINDWEEYIGRFTASERVEVRSKVNGYIEDVRFKDGDIVKQGQVLFVIDQRPYYIALKQAEAEKMQAEADLNRTTSDYNRIASVKDSRAVSIEEVEQRQQIAKSAEARLMAANAQLEDARLNLSYTEIKAPISGKISDDFIDKGNYVTGGASNATVLTTVLTIDPIHFYFEVNENDLAKAIGNSNSQEVSVRLADEAQFSREGELDFVDNEVDQSTGTVRERAVFHNPDFQLQSGMFGRLRVTGSKMPTLLIPDVAVGSNQSQKVVYVIDADNTIKVRPVELGKLYQQKYRIVTSGLAKGDRVVVGNLLKIRPGMVVDPRKDAFAIGDNAAKAGELAQK